MRREWLEKDYYQALGVDPTASDAKIKKAYRKLAQQYHPDNNPGDEAAETRFKEVSEAYATLSDTEDRKQYDATREAVQRGTFTGDGTGGDSQYVRIDDLGDLGDLFGGGMFGGLGDLFGFGGKGRRPAPQQGRDREAEVSLTFHEAISGVTKTIEADGTSMAVPGSASAARDGPAAVADRPVTSTSGCGPEPIRSSAGADWTSA
jgi:molecular chaperone DnaJ